MNQAYVDASWHERPDGSGVGGWGLVLLLPGELPTRYQGQLDAPDNNAAELRAVLEAVRHAPVGEPLTVYTDNEAVIASVGRGRGPHLLADLAREALDETQAREVALRVEYVPRTRRHMLSAHELANDARRGLNTPATAGPHADVLIEQRPAVPEARVSLRRHGERVTALVNLDPLSDVPPSAQALLAAVTLARAGEVLLVRRASKIAQALWQRPERALLPAAHAQLAQARQAADGLGVQVQFQQTP
ncbi:ribonuclease HI [Deinococcus hopiensis]|uniref:Ribonuclease HI n=1 Tax=Deinococcus hopiensis KR-140 TaxID=695939 RepID=A0A1W1VRF7_9DEIO|nr:RNase H family protein [Deinococcus hopiensis]SMB95937.1 Ribonuclease HI [Deinococcus hopiensis KR-140]